MPNLPIVTDPGGESQKSEGERWISFLRGYGPVNKVDGMYAETIRKHALAYGVEPLRFEHPLASDFFGVFRPGEGILTNVVLTGTAGDGKTTLCNELWQSLSGGDTSRIDGKNRENYRALTVDTPSGPKAIHFVFEFSGFAPEYGEWDPAKLDLLDRLAASILDPDPDEFFIIAANDGKLVKEWEGLPAGGGAARLAPYIEEFLATGKRAIKDLNLVFMNLSKMSTRDIFVLASDSLLGRKEWRCFEDEASDPAFGPDSPLTKNYRLLSDGAVRGRLEALAELCDANGLHVSIREVLLLLVNALLGHSGSPDCVMKIAGLRELALAKRANEAALYNNVFGGNLSERRRDHFAVFRFLGGFRIGLETTNLHDSLIVFGPEDPAFFADHERILRSDEIYGENLEFERLRQEYLEAEENRNDSSAFLVALLAERRRLFFRLDDNDLRFDPWRLSVFEAAGSYRSEILYPLIKGESVPTAAISLLVQGLNRIWTGMLVAELDKLYLSTGLDVTTARVSEIFLYEIPIQPGFHGSGITIGYDRELRFPILKVAIDRDHSCTFPLHLVRYEFLTRVARGALPSSFSKECYEDVVAFKTKVLAEFYRLNARRPMQLSILSSKEDGILVTRQLGVNL
jgi:hypothetical protein